MGALQHKSQVYQGGTSYPFLQGFWHGHVARPSQLLPERCVARRSATLQLVNEVAQVELGVDSILRLLS